MTLKQKQKTIHQSSVRDSPHEPLAEGAIPLNKNKTRKWNMLSDEALIIFADNFLEKNDLSEKFDLVKADVGLYIVLRRRKLLSRVRFVGKRMKQRKWKLMNDTELLGYTKEAMERARLSGKKELAVTDPGLYEELRKRTLLEQVGFVPLHKWYLLSDVELVTHVREFMRINNISGRTRLFKVNGGLYNVLRKRNLLDEVGFGEKRMKQRSWASMSNPQLVEFALEYMEEKRITGRKQLENADPRLYDALRRRNLLDKISSKKKRRDPREWSSMTGSQIIMYARDLIADNGIKGRTQLSKFDTGLYEALRKKNLLDHLFPAPAKQSESELLAQLKDAVELYLGKGEQE